MPPSVLRELTSASTRMGLWSRFIGWAGIRRMAEIGVMSGDFAAAMLEASPIIERYLMIDPWRHLQGWNKPANLTDEQFARCREHALERTEWASSRRVVLRGTTSEVCGEIEDGSLDLAYIDGDHTLRGITIDLVNMFPKVREGGWIGGDDFVPSIWQHRRNFEPTLVFPFAVHFAEAMDVAVYGLPHSQFLIHKVRGFSFTDLVGTYGDTSLRSQFVESQARSGPADSDGATVGA